MLLGSLISAAFVWLFIRNIAWQSLGRTFTHVHLRYLAPAILIYLLALLVRGVRWHFLLRSMKAVPCRFLMGSVLIGFAANALLPARSGEVVRAYALSRKSGVPTSTVLGSIVVERLFDGFTVLALLALSLGCVHLPAAGAPQLLSDQVLRRMGWFALALFLVIGGMLALLQWSWPRAEKLISLALRPFRPSIRESALNLARSFAAGLRLSRGVDLAAVVLLSVVVWLLGAASIAALFPAFDLPFSLTKGIFSQVVIALAVMIPAAPGFLGTFHAGVAASLIALGIGATSAQSFALVLWFVNFVPVTVVGLLVAWSYGLSLRGLPAREGTRATQSALNQEPAGR